MCAGVKAPGRRAGPTAGMLALDEMILGGGGGGGGGGRPGVGDGGGMGAKNGSVFAPSLYKHCHLPRQARDKPKGILSKTSVTFGFRRDASGYVKRKVCLIVYRNVAAIDTARPTLV